jgi:lipopolysaccharide transport system permease protein
MFLSPIIYPLKQLPAKWQMLLMLNPLTGIVHNFRVALFANGPFDWRSLGVSAAITLIVLLYSMFSFRRMERHFADTV